MVQAPHQPCSPVAACRRQIEPDRRCTKKSSIATASPPTPHHRDALQPHLGDIQVELGNMSAAQLLNPKAESRVC